MTELRLVRAVDRIESLKSTGRWSFRQPKKQRGVGGLVKTHWDYLLDEMVNNELDTIDSVFYNPTEMDAHRLSGRTQVEDGTCLQHIHVCS